MSKYHPYDQDASSSGNKEEGGESSIIYLRPWRSGVARGDLSADCRVKPAQSMDEFFMIRIPWWKRVMDVCISAVALVVLAPIMLIVAIIIKKDSKGPAIFAQKRGGLGGKPFMLYKFRSMVVDAEERKKDLVRFNERQGPAFKMTHDPRVTAVGQFLRKTSLDELPQLLNVLKGDMSLVGPRPLPCDEDKGYDQWHWRRLMVKPGADVHMADHMS